jgi:hypothetical protein
MVLLPVITVKVEAGLNVNALTPTLVDNPAAERFTVNV